MTTMTMTAITGLLRSARTASDHHDRHAATRRAPPAIGPFVQGQEPLGEVRPSRTRRPARGPRPRARARRAGVVEQAAQRVAEPAASPGGTSSASRSARATLR